VIIVVGRRSVTVSTVSLEEATETAAGIVDVSGAAGLDEAMETVVINVVERRRVTVPPAGMDGFEGTDSDFVRGAPLIDPDTGIGATDIVGTGTVEEAWSEPTSVETVFTVGTEIEEVVDD
jgi:hypothetical protein